MQSKTRLAVFIGLLLAQVATVATLVLAGGRIWAGAEAEHTAALLDAVADQSTNQVRAHIEPAASIVALTASLAAEPDMSSDVFADTFLDALQRSPQLAGVFIGSPDGGFTYVSRTGEGYRLKSIEVSNTSRTTELTFFDADGTVEEVRPDPEDTYDPTGRPWYTLAEGAPGEVVWTDPYVFFTSRQLGITAAQTIVRDGEVLGVVGADIELGSLSSFLNTLAVGDEGGTVIVNQAGTVIAHPDPSLIQQSEGEGYRTVSVAEIEDAYARAAVATLVAGGAQSDLPVQQFDDATHGASWAAFGTAPVGDDVWTVGVFGPDGDLVGDLTAARGQERWLTTIVGLLAVLLFGLAALPATRPIGDLETRARTDALTGLANRRTIFRRADEVARQSNSRAAAMIDLDCFKLVNDTYGHQVGDEVLGAVAKRVASVLRSEVALGRVGGEEFLVLFPDIGPDEALAACERIRSAVRSAPVRTTAGQIEVTASIGLAVVDGPCSRAALLEKADFALLRAKQEGRDRVVVHDTSLDSVFAEQPVAR